MRRSVKHVASVAGQLAMIAVGAYLGLQAEQWREDRSKAALARATLRNFRDEIAANRAAITAVHTYHDSATAGLNRVLGEQMRAPRPINLIEVATRSGFNGTNTADLQTTAYDLAVATQALGELPPELSVRLARLYTRQRSLASFQDQLAQAMMNNTPSPRDEASRTLFMLQQGMREIDREEARLVAAYDSTTPRLDLALARR